MKPMPTINTINRPSLATLAAMFLIPGALPGTANAGLVAHWKLNEASGTTAASEANSPAADGTLVGNAAFGGAVSPAPGSTASLSLNGGNVTHGMTVDPAAMHVNGSLSVATWVYVTSGANNIAFVGNTDTIGGAYQHNYTLRRINGDLHFMLRDSSNNTASFTGGALALNQWVHLAATFDSTTRVAKIYVNGSETGTATMPAFTGFASQDKAGLGCYAGGWNPVGRMDDVAVWDEALSETQIGNVINHGAADYNNSSESATIVSFTATPEDFVAGETLTLAWEVTDADSVSIDQGVGTVATTGTLDRTPGATTTWTLTATRGVTQVTAQATATLSKGQIDVFLLSGQSNMQGNALSSDLPAELLSIPEIQLYAAGSHVNNAIANQWVTLQPSSSSFFGPEIGVGERLRDLCPGQPIALIKYVASGNSLEINFKPGANASDTANWGGAFTAMVNTFNNGLAALEAEGWQPVIKGMCWQQGEQDAKDGLNAPESSTSADDYGANLAHFVGRIREQFAAHASPDGIRFVPGQVLPYAPAGGDVATRFPGRTLVRQAILDADEDSGAPLSVANTRAIATNETDHPTHAQVIDGYRDTDEVHLSATALLALGRSMAYAMLDLDPQSYIDWGASFSLVGGPSDDDDFDGLTNWEEYAFRGDPTDAADTPRPSLAAVPDGQGGQVPTYTLARSLEALDVVPEIQLSLDLLDWTTFTPLFLSSVKGAGGVATLSYRTPWLLGDPAYPATFFRTRLSSP